MKLLGLLVMVIVVSGCMSDGRPHHLNEALRLQPRELGHLVAEAAKGDGAAAWRIFVHYDAYANDVLESEKWLRKAAELGHEGASQLLSKRQKPNKAPEPTPGAVTPRATEGTSK